MPKFSIYINESEKAKLEQIAKREGKTRNAVIREAVQDKCNLCAFCGDPVSNYPNNGYAHHDCARDFEIKEWEYE